MTKQTPPGAEAFRPTSGRLAGAFTLVLAATVIVVGLVELRAGFPPWVIALAALVGVLAWASMLRPALWATSDELVLRNMFETVHIPLAAVESLALRQVLAVRAGDRRHVSTAVGRTWRKSAFSGKPGRGGPHGEGTAATMSYPDYVEDRLRRLVDDARAVAGVRPGSAEQLALADGVRREPAWLPIGLTALPLLALVVTLLV